MTFQDAKNREVEMYIGEDVAKNKIEWFKASFPAEREKILTRLRASEKNHGGLVYLSSLAREDANARRFLGSALKLVREIISGLDSIVAGRVPADLEIWDLVDLIFEIRVRSGSYSNSDRYAYVELRQCFRVVEKSFDWLLAPDTDFDPREDLKKSLDFLEKMFWPVGSASLGPASNR